MEEIKKGESEEVDIQLPMPPKTTSLPSIVKEVNSAKKENKSEEVGEEKKVEMIKIKEDETGVSYESLFSNYLKSAERVVISDPYLRANHQLVNLQHFLELCVEQGGVKEIHVVTNYNANDIEQKEKMDAAFVEMKESLQYWKIYFDVEFKESLHDREIELSNGWHITLGRGLDFFKKSDFEGKYSVGRLSQKLRKCQETSIQIFKRNK